MNKKYWGLLILIVIAILFAFRSQLYDFFISPDGLSIAPSEICLHNKTDKELIAELDTFVGAQIETILFAGEKVCAPSPNEEVMGEIKVGLSGAEGYSCILKMDKEGDAYLKGIGEDGQCEWAK